MSSSPDPIEAVSQRLSTFFAAQRQETESWGPEAAALLEVAASTVAGGKRLRARFCLTGWEAVAETHGDLSSPPEAVVSAAAALEVFHAAALVHDDIIDNSDTRRGRPAAHRQLEGAHRDARWHGDAAAFGRSAGVLLGDLLVAWSDDLLESGLAHAGACAPDARRQYAIMRRDVTVGQFLDIAEESAFAVSPDEEHAERALRVASLKSARYSVEQPLLIGAALAGADEGQRAALSGFGHPIGMAFQLRDDVLGVFGDERETGKPSGDDLREGKRTVLIAYARQGVPAAVRRTMDELLGDPALDAEQIGSLQRTLVESGAVDRVERLIADYARTADRALAGADLGTRAVGRLRDLARAATERRS
ncbi:polyprenyl synthetase family protein [Microbacterium sp. SORGH_AS_0888]|uniref:polyprenyl synthetase family protein n=1 Tax=Microbacterium sp. SORGH_AS_0888 TaxID=3041791 RepID=UPI00277E3675|nr:polyprenyl synthetase family protein [Microbacterium sp. SORGH_AS_0888]MDQ1128891.1 geranylgeranyl diphosphate synthase type I [Microbacterium sp. SORGH_AS_0888]